MPRPTLPACIALAAVTLAGCGSSGQTSLAKLAANQDAYLGKRISTSGTVEAQRNPNGSRYYLLADPEQNLVVLLPSRAARSFLGEAVAVTGASASTRTSAA